MSVWDKLRVTNGIFWIWMWFSSAMLPVGQGGGNLILEKAKQFITLNPNLHNTPKFVGNGIVIVALWFGMDWIIRRKQKKNT